MRDGRSTGSGRPRATRRSQSIRRALLGDALCALGPAALLAWLRSAAVGAPPVPTWAAWALALAASWVTVLFVLGGYRGELLRTGNGETGRVLAAAVSLSAVDVVLWLAGRDLSHRLVLITLGLTAAATVARRRTRRRGLWREDGNDSPRRDPRIRRRAEPAPPSRRRWDAAAGVADRVLAAVIAASLLPVLVAVAIAVKLTGRGPVLVRQVRRVADGRSVRVLAFRTTNARGTAPDQCDGPVSGIGRVLQRLALDQLPRLLDVVRGVVPLARSTG